MEIPRITVTDATLLDTLVAAFADDPLYRWLYPDPSTRPAALRANLDLTLAAARERGGVTTDEQGTAVAMWTRPGVELLDDPAPFVDLLERWAPDRRDAAFAGMAACATYADPADHVLHVLAVHPDRQNRGAAAQLLQPMLRRLDREGRTAYLESSSARNLSFYRRCGFVVLGEVTVPGRWTGHATDASRTVRERVRSADKGMELHVPAMKGAGESASFVALPHRTST